ncbi:MAG: hypothetical protein KGL39_17530 [Patescibacteria group bacterium]|nr:hypothetical protein [Patescibacteria group bacterium]
MPFTDPQLKKLLQEHIQWEQYAGTDDYGGSTYAAAVSLACYVEGINAAIRQRDGTVIVSRQIVYVSGDDPNAANIGLHDRFTPIGQGAEGALKPLKIQPYYDDRGRIWLVEVTL